MVKLASGTSLRSVADILRNAAVFGRSHWAGNGPLNMTPAPDANLPQQIHDLFALLRDRQVDYLLVGGIALLRYIDGRNTEDIDLLLPVESLTTIPELKVLYASGLIPTRVRRPFGSARGRRVR